MRNNIYCIIGDNASGKTRFLTHLCEENTGVVTNLPIGGGGYFECLDKSNILRATELKPISFGEELWYSSHLSNLYKMIVAKGNYLVLDELDSCLLADDLLRLCACISELRDCWKGIYVSGFSSYLDRLFSRESTHERLCNYCIVDLGLNLVPITEEDADECFDSF